MIISRLLQNRALQKTLTLFGALILCVMSGACLTSQLYQGKKAPLQEQITGFLLNPAQQQIVFVGQKHHYIFPLPDDLKQLLMWPGHKMFNTSGLNFVISRGDHIQGRYMLTVENGAALGSDDQLFLINHGFKAVSNSRYLMQGQLKQGTVYDAGKFSLPQMETLQTPLPLTIRYDYASTGQVISRVLLTPLSVAADGVSVVVGAVVLLPILAVSGINTH